MLKTTRSASLILLVSAPQKKKKCEQDKTGRDRPDILDFLDRAGLSDFISNIRSAEPKNPEGMIFDISDRDKFVGILDADDRFRRQTPFGGEHTEQVGGNIGNTLDYRSFTDSDGLGSDSEGLRRSLQVDVGPKGTIPDTPEGALGYADLDSDNPAQDVVSGARHGGPIVLRKLGRIFGRIFGR